MSKISTSAAGAAALLTGAAAFFGAAFEAGRAGDLLTALLGAGFEADFLCWFLLPSAAKSSFKSSSGAAGAAALLTGAAFTGAATFFGAGDCFLEADLAGLAFF